ncbi:N-acyl homoserine lactonase family protein [soil metagenome]
MSADYEILAVRYGRFHRRSSENFFGGDSHDVAMPLDYYVWIIRGGGRAFVVDMGFAPDMALKRGRTILRPVGEGLSESGLNPDTVTDVIVSHMHYDHVGNIDLFPQARFHIQDMEMAYCTGRCMCHATVNAPFESSHVATMVHRVFEGRVSFHDGDSELAPGLTLHRVGGHSRGLQVIRVKTQRGFVVLASDAAHFYANMERGKPFPVFDTLASVLDGVERMRRLATSERHIVPGHDPLVLKRYPLAHQGLADVVRLDLDPLI